MKRFIMEIPGVETPGFCNHLITKFETDKNIDVARIGWGKIDEKIRNSKIKYMKQDPGWNWEVMQINRMLSPHIERYVAEIHGPVLHSELRDYYMSSHTMLKYTPGNVGYEWHNDFMYDETEAAGGLRTITWIMYLNDVLQGGDTQFIDGTRVKGQTGKLLLFPSCWTYVHRGMPVIQGVKYALCGWVCSSFNRDRTYNYKLLQKLHEQGKL